MSPPHDCISLAVSSIVVCVLAQLLLCSSGWSMLVGHWSLLYVLSHDKNQTSLNLAVNVFTFTHMDGHMCCGSYAHVFVGCRECDINFCILTANTVASNTALVSTCLIVQSKTSVSSLYYSTNIYSSFMDYSVFCCVYRLFCLC